MQIRKGDGGRQSLFTNKMKQRFYILLTALVLFALGYQRYYEHEMDKKILEEQERANKIAQRNHQLYLEVTKENRELKRAIKEMSEHDK